MLRYQNVKRLFSFHIKEIRGNSINSSYIHFLIAFIFYYPILYASVYYADDVSRSYFGHFSWTSMGRPLADVVALAYSSISEMRKPVIVDVYPLSFFLTVFLVALSSILIKMKIARLSPKLATPLSLIFIINPFQLENALYRFDSIGMFLAMLIICFVFYLKDHKSLWIPKFLLLLFSLCLYQPLINLYFGLISLRLFVATAEGRREVNTLKRVVPMVVIACLSIVSYFLLIKSFGHTRADTRGSLIELGVHFPIELIENYWDALLVYANFWRYFSPYIVLLLPFPIIFFVRKISQPKDILITLSATLLFIFSTVGFMAFLNEQLLAARTLPIFSISLMLFFIAMYSIFEKIRFLILLPVFACLIFSYRIGNTLKLQADFERPIFSMLAADVASFGNNYKVISIGSVPLSPVAKIISEKSPFGAFLDRTKWNTSGRMIHSGIENTQFYWSESYYRVKTRFDNKVSIEKSPIVKRASLYKIYKTEDYLWVHWQSE